MSFLIDTNVIYEIRKGARCDGNVASWYAPLAEEDLYLSVLVTGEIRKGVELARRKDVAKAAMLEAWLLRVETAFGPRILPVDRAVTDMWGRMNAVRPVPVVDGLLAASAVVFGLTLATRNASDVIGLGADVINPFETTP